VKGERPEQMRVQSDAGEPAGSEAGVLAVVICPFSGRPVNRYSPDFLPVTRR
jgi:hypothetical protein